MRPFQDVLIELGARLGLPAFVNEDGTPRYRDYPDYIVNHERMPGVGPLAGSGPRSSRALASALLAGAVVLLGWRGGERRAGA